MYLIILIFVPVLKNFLKMKRGLVKYIILLAMLALPLSAFAENGKFYTRKALLEDFPARVTKVVLSGNAISDAVFREEVTLRWNLSPYEFCTVDDYEALKEDPNYYFLHFVKLDDVVFLSLDKGGRKDDPDVKKQSFEVISIPVSGADAQVLDNLGYLPGFIDVIQNFVENAMTSDSKAYTGLAQYNFNDIGKRRIILDPEKAGEAFRDGHADTLVGISVSTGKPRIGSWCYKMLISCDTHQIFYFKKHKITEKQKEGWLASEIKRFNGNSAE